MNSEDKIKNIL